MADFELDPNLHNSELEQWCDPLDPNRAAHVQELTTFLERIGSREHDPLLTGNAQACAASLMEAGCTSSVRIGRLTQQQMASKGIPDGSALSAYEILSHNVGLRPCG